MNTGDTAWVLMSTALVFAVTIPGLAFFYGVLVRRKDVLSILMQCFIKGARTGEVGDGKIFILDLQKDLTIMTGETDGTAIG